MIFDFPTMQCFVKGRNGLNKKIPCSVRNCKFINFTLYDSTLLFLQSSFESRYSVLQVY